MTAAPRFSKQITRRLESHGLWDWRKYDFGFRLGVVRGLDLTAEYARNGTTTRKGVLHPDEGLLTLHAAF
jgi:hypothetical protein